MKLLVTTLTILVSMLAMVYAHPSDGFETLPLPSGYKSAGPAYGSEWNQGELAFLEEYPDPETLTQAERFILSGSKGSSYGHPLRPWVDEIFGYITAYESRTGQVPTDFSPEYFNENMTGDVLSEDELARFRNPITDTWPTFKDSSWVSGGAYVRKLTTQEMQYYAGISSQYNDMWFESRTFDAATDSYISGKLTSPVFYVRIYGENNNVILTRLMFDFRFNLP